MGEFMHPDGWDLEAVVRGHMSQAAAYAGSCDMVEWFDSFLGDYDDPLMRSNTGSGWDHRFSLDDFPTGFSETTMSMVLDDDPAEILPVSVVGSTCNNIVEAGGKLQQGARTSVLDLSPGVEEAVHVVAKYKRRKNQQKQVVQQVTADGTSSDLWAWRKYGQKPIKGSPYPRSYYRCSSSKGCMARKQVERSSSEPGMFIVTYSGEHSHTQPTRRSALAGITRPSKFAAPKRSSSSANATKYQVQVQQSNSKSPQETLPVNNIYEGSSPISVSTVDDGPSKIETTLAWTERRNLDEIVYPPSLVLGEEMFLGFDELEGLGMDFALTGC